MLETMGQKVQVKGFNVDEVKDFDAPCERFRVIKKAAFEKLGYWHWSTSFNNPKDDGIYAETQLLGVIVENLFDPKSAQKNYKGLLTSPLFNPDLKMWRFATNINKSENTSIQSITADQFLGIYADYTVLGLKSDEKINKLNEKLLVKTQSLWPNGIVGDIRLLNNISTFDNLAGVLVENIFDSDVAKNKLDSLKRTELFDQKRRLWFNGLYDVGGVDETLKRCTQLLSVIVESQFNKEQALDQLNSLKKTVLYDSLEKRWYQTVSERNSLRFNDETNVTDKLLEIWSDHLLKNYSTHLERSSKLPERRLF